MNTWPKDNQADRNAFYGDPGKGEIADQLVPVIPPFAMYYDGKKINNILFHHKAAPALAAALKEIWDYYGHDQSKIDAVGVSKYAGAYNHRMVRGSSTKWSNHAYGAAIDLNAEENAMYAKGNMPQPVIDAFCRQGWMWGGWYNGRKDPMHFEAVYNGGRVPTQNVTEVKMPNTKPVTAPPNPVVAHTTTAVATTTIAATAVAASNAGLSAWQILAIIGGVSFAIGVVIIVGYRLMKGYWPWTSTGKVLQEQSPLLHPNLVPSLEQLSAALSGVSSAASQEMPSRRSSGQNRRRKQLGKRSPKTRTPLRKSSNSKRITAKKSVRKPKSKSRG